MNATEKELIDALSDVYAQSSYAAIAELRRQRMAELDAEIAERKARLKKAVDDALEAGVTRTSIWRHAGIDLRTIRKIERGES